MVRQHRRARLAALSLLVAALHAADQGRPPHARIHRPRPARRGGARQGGARQPQPGAEAIRRTRPPEKFHAHSKYWQELLGQYGGAVRRPMLELTDAEKDATRRAFETCGLKLDGQNLRPSAA